MGTNNIYFCFNPKCLAYSSLSNSASKQSVVLGDIFHVLHPAIWHLGVLVNSIIQKLKSKHLVCLSFLLWQNFLREGEKIFYTYSGPRATDQTWISKSVFSLKWRLSTSVKMSCKASRLEFKSQQTKLQVTLQFTRTHIFASLFVTKKIYAITAYLVCF